MTIIVCPCACITTYTHVYIYMYIYIYKYYYYYYCCCYYCYYHHYYILSITIIILITIIMFHMWLHNVTYASGICWLVMLMSLDLSTAHEPLLEDFGPVRNSGIRDNARSHGHIIKWLGGNQAMHFGVQGFQ